MTHHLVVLETGARGCAWNSSVMLSRYPQLFGMLAIATKVAGLTHEQCAATKAGKKPEGLSSAAAASYDASYHLANKPGPLPKDLYDRCVQELGKEGTLLLTHYVAMYCYMCVLMNAMDVPLPEGVEQPV